MTRFYGFFHCDNCGHEENAEGPIGQEMVGRRCSKCGSVVLTQEEFNNARPVQEMLYALEDEGVSRMLPPGERGNIHAHFKGSEQHFTLRPAEIKRPAGRT